MAPGARSNFGAPCRNMRSFGRNALYRRKYLWHCWDFSAPRVVIRWPHSHLAPGEFCPPWPPRYAPGYEAIKNLVIYAICLFDAQNGWPWTRIHNLFAHASWVQRISAIQATKEQAKDLRFHIFSGRSSDLPRQQQEWCHCYRKIGKNFRTTLIWARRLLNWRFGQVYLMCLIFVKSLPILGKVD